MILLTRLKGFVYFLGLTQGNAESFDQKDAL